MSDVNEDLLAARAIIETLPGKLGFLSEIRWNSFPESFFGLKAFSLGKVSDDVFEAIGTILDEAGIIRSRMSLVPDRPFIRTDKEIEREDLEPREGSFYLLLNKTELERVKAAAEIRAPDVVLEVSDLGAKTIIAGRGVELHFFPTEERGSAVGRLEERRTKGSDGRDGPS